MFEVRWFELGYGGCLQNDDLENNDLENDDLESDDLENDDIKKNTGRGLGV